jgi:hypothetical protein
MWTSQQLKDSLGVTKCSSVFAYGSNVRIAKTHLAHDRSYVALRSTAAE